MPDAQKPPRTLLARPHHDDVPIPFVATSTDGAHGQKGGVVDLEGVDPALWSEAVQGRRCGLCGEPLGYWLAFVGDETAVERRRFERPAMHPECAELGVSLYPFLKVAEGRTAIYVTRTYEMRKRIKRDEFGTPRMQVFVHPAPAKRVEWRD